MSGTEDITKKPVQFESAYQEVQQTRGKKGVPGCACERFRHKLIPLHEVRAEPIYVFGSVYNPLGNIFMWQFFLTNFKH